MSKKQFNQNSIKATLRRPKIIELNRKEGQLTTSVVPSKEAIIISINERTVSCMDKDHTWLKKLEKTVQLNASNFHYNVKQMAKDMNISRQHLTRRLKQMTGLTALQYLKEIRLKRAKSLLENKVSISVKAVALDNGYMDVKYFSRQFFQRFGQLPSSSFSR